MALLELTTQGSGVELGVHSSFRARVRWTLEPGPLTPTDTRKQIIFYSPRRPNRIRIRPGFWDKFLPTTIITAEQADRLAWADAAKLWSTSADQTSFIAAAGGYTWDRYNGEPTKHTGYGLYQKTNGCQLDWQYDTGQPNFSIVPNANVINTAPPAPLHAPAVTITFLDIPNGALDFDVDFTNTGAQDRQCAVLFNFGRTRYGHRKYYRAGSAALNDNGDGTSSCVYNFGGFTAPGVPFPSPCTLAFRIVDAATGQFSLTSFLNI